VGVCKPDPALLTLKHHGRDYSVRQVEDLPPLYPEVGQARPVSFKDLREEHKYM
jgi:hypothetical protein